MMSDSRRYEHDCDDCQYLGQYLEYDAYYCPREDTLIARWGIDGKYFSRPASMKLNQPIMNVVQSMAAAYEI